MLKPIAAETRTASEAGAANRAPNLSPEFSDPPKLDNLKTGIGRSQLLARKH
jgi:hypothetical protein